MSEQQVWALIVLAIIVIVLPVSLLPTWPLDGRQKYRSRSAPQEDATARSVNPVIVALSFFTGGAIGGSNDSSSADGGEGDAGFDGGDGGGD